MENQSTQKSASQGPASNVVSIADASKRAAAEPTPQVSKPGSHSAASESVKAEIEQRLGYFPPPLLPALDNPAVLESLWSQMRSGYLDNPLPALFKEKLQARLARYCGVPYAIVSHVTALRQMGLSARDVLDLLNLSTPVGESDLDQYLAVFDAEFKASSHWPKHNTLPDRGLLHCSLYFYVKPGRSSRIQAALSQYVGPELYAHLISFLSYVKSYHHLVESNPGPPIESVARVWDKFLVMLREEPRLAKIFRDYRQSFGDRQAGVKGEGSQQSPAELHARLKKTTGELAKAIEILKDEIPKRKQIERELLANQERFGELFENTADMVVSFDLSGGILAVNRAGERITGYSRDEVLRMNITQLISPEHAEVSLRLLDPKACVESPAVFPLVILTKDNVAEPLEAHQRLISRNRKTVEFQVVARRINEAQKSSESQAAEPYKQALAELEARVKKKMAAMTHANESLQAQLNEQKCIEASLRATLAETGARSGELFKSYTSLQVQIARSETDKDQIQGPLTEPAGKLAGSPPARQDVPEQATSQRRENETLHATLTGGDAHTLESRDFYQQQLAKEAGVRETLQSSLAVSESRLGEVLESQAASRLRIAQLEAEMEALRNSLAERDAKIIEVVRLHEAPESQIPGHETEKESLRKALAEAQARLDEIHTYQEALQAEITAHKDANQSLQATLSEAEARAAEAIKAYAKVFEQISGLQSANRGLQKSHAESEARLAEAIKTHEDLNARIAGLMSERDELRNALAESKSRIAEVLKTYDDFQGRISSLLAEKESLERSAALAESRLAETLQAHEVLQSKVAGHETEKLMLQEALSESEEKLQKTLKEYEEFQPRISSFLSEKESLERSLAAAEAQAAEFIAVHGALRAQISGHEAENESLRGRLAETEGRLSDVLKAHEVYQAQISGLRDQRELLQKSLAESETRLGETLQSHQAYLAQLPTQEADKESLKSALEQAEGRLAVSLKSEEVLQAKIAGYLGEKEELRNALWESENRLAEVFKTHQSLQERIAASYREREALQNTVAEREAQLSRIAEVHGSVQERLAQIRTDKDVLQAALAQAENKFAETAQSQGALQAQVTGHEKTIESLRKSAVDAAVRFLDQIDELAKANDGLRIQISQREHAEQTLRGSLAESEAKSSEILGTNEALQARLDQYRREMEAQRVASAEEEARLRARMDALVKTVDALHLQIGEHNRSLESLQGTLSISESAVGELRSSNESLQSRLAAAEAAEKATRETFARSESWKNELEEHNRQLALLSEMGNMLRACMNTGEAVAVIAQQIEQIFPNHSGTLYLMKSDQNLVESAFDWGVAGSSKPAFAPDECVALRRNCVHAVKSTRAGLLCKHVQAPPPPGYVCVPMIAQREVLGVLHLSEHSGEHLSETGRRLAATVTEYIAMALSNLILHEKPRS